MAQTTIAMQHKAEQLADQAHTWQTGRSKQDGSGFFLVPSSDDPEHIAHRCNRFGCTCKGNRHRGICTHQMACQIIDRRAWGERITAAQVRPAAPTHGARSLTDESAQAALDTIMAKARERQAHAAAHQERGAR